MNAHEFKEWFLQQVNDYTEEEFFEELVKNERAIEIWFDDEKKPHFCLTEGSY